MIHLKIRLAYSKTKEAKYIAHLDLTRMFDRALRRAQIDVAYSEGFNPHPKISFGPPLPVGVESVREFVDIDLREDQNLPEVAQKLQAQLPEGIELTDWAIRPQGDKAITAVLNLAYYRVHVPFTETMTIDRLEKACESWLSRTEVTKKRFAKGKQVDRNLRPFVKRIEVASPENEKEADLIFDMVIGNSGSVRPVEILESIAELERIPVDLPGAFTVREGLFVERADGTTTDPLKQI